MKKIWEIFLSFHSMGMFKNSFDEDVALIPLPPPIDVALIPLLPAKEDKIDNLILSSETYWNFVSKFNHIDRNVYNQWILNMKR